MLVCYKRLLIKYMLTIDTTSVIYMNKVVLLKFEYQTIA